MRTQIELDDEYQRVCEQAKFVSERDGTRICINIRAELVNGRPALTGCYMADVSDFAEDSTVTMFSCGRQIDL